MKCRISMEFRGVWRTMRPAQFVAAVLLTLACTAASARANFVLLLNSTEQKLFVDAADNASHTIGHAGSQSSSLIVGIDAVGNVDFANGFSTIKPVKNSTLTSLTFTPQDASAFNSFSFRGQMEDVGDITITVTDNQGNGAQTFTVHIDKANQNFDRIGILSLDGETIQSVKLESAGFKDEKENMFGLSSTPPLPIPEPASCLLFGIGAIGLAGYGWRRRRNQQPQDC